MGPTNQALLALFRADSALRRAQEDLDSATRGVRVQRKRAEIAEANLAQTLAGLKHVKAQQMELDSDLKQRDDHIEHLRLQQQEAQNHKQYQAFLGAINTQKNERGRVEEEAEARLKDAEQLDAQQVQQREQAAAERQKAEQLQSDIGETTSTLEARIADLQPQRDAAADKVPAAPRGVFERLADNYDGEAMAPIGHIDAKEEGYYCTACNMELIADVYNRLKTRDDVVTCPGCGRLLYIPEELTPEMAVRQKKVAKRAPRKAAKKTAKKAAKKTKTGVPADLKRAVTTAAAESGRQAQVDATPPVQAEVRIAGVDDAMGPFPVRDAAHFRSLINAKVQAEDIEATFDVVDLSAPEPGAADVGVPATAGDDGEVAGLVGDPDPGGTIAPPAERDADSKRAAAEVGAEVTPAETEADGDAGSPSDDPADRVPSQPTIAPPADDETVPVGDVPDSPPAPANPLP